MRIAVIGTGYVGLVVGACLAETGNDVICVDKDAAKIRTLNRGQIPIYEPGLSDLVRRNRIERRLTFTTKLDEAVKKAIDDLDNVKATESFTAAVEGLQQGGDLSRDFPALLDAWTMKAAGHATGGENLPAKKDMEAVIGLNAKVEFSPTYFPPDLIKFAEATRKIATNAKGELLVRTEPAGARVWVDGTFRGISPVAPSPDPNGGLWKVGGDFLLLNSLEYQVPVRANDQVSLVAFVDSGTVSARIDNWDTYRVSAGFGVRFVVP